MESCLKARLSENLNAEIAIGTVNSLDDAVGYLTWTFFARRVKANPSYYGALSSSDEHVQTLLLSVVKETLESLREQGCVVAPSADLDGDIQTTTLGIAASNYYLTHRTPKQMQFGVREARKLILKEVEAGVSAELKAEKLAKLKAKKGSMKLDLLPFTPSKRVDEVSAAWLLYSLSCTHEFDELPVRHNEEILNEELSGSLMWGPDTATVISGNRPYADPEVFADPHTK